MYPDQSSQNLWEWGQASVFFKTGPGPIHIKLRSTIDYTDLSGLIEEKTLQVPSNHQYRTHYFSKQL